MLSHAQPFTLTFVANSRQSHETAKYRRSYPPELVVRSVDLHTVPSGTKMNNNSGAQVLHCLPFLLPYTYLPYLGV